MNRTNDKEFFRCWDTSKSILEPKSQCLSPKERLEQEALVDAFFDEYGFLPTNDYQELIHKWKEEHDFRDYDAL